MFRNNYHIGIVCGIITLLLLLFLADRVGGIVMDAVHRHSNDATAPKLNCLANDCEADLVILGSSRAGSHYIPSIMEDSLKMTVYNGGIDGSNNIYAHYIALSLLLRHHTPSVILLELMDSDFCIQENPYMSIPFFAPYYGISEEADSLFDISGYGKIYKLSHLARYNAKAVSNIGGLFKEDWNVADKGFIAAPSGKITNKSIAKEKQRKVDCEKLKYLIKFINKCHEKGILLIFTISPRYSKVDQKFYEPIRIIAAKHSVQLIDSHTAGQYLDKPEYFRDQTHLNLRGATNYTKGIILKLKIRNDNHKVLSKVAK